MLIAKWLWLWFLNTLVLGLFRLALINFRSWYKWLRNRRKHLTLLPPSTPISSFYLSFPSFLSPTPLLPTTWLSSVLMHDDEVGDIVCSAGLHQLAHDIVATV